MREFLLFFGAILPLIGGGIYVASILAGKTRPQRMTRFLLFIITGLSTAALFANQDTSGVWLAVASFLQSLVICVLALKFGIGGTGKQDIICLLLCFLGIGLWLFTGEPLLGLLAAIAADFIAVLPALSKTIRLPHTEIWLFYAVDAVAAGLILVAGPYGWSDMLYPLYLMTINLLFVLVIIGLSGFKRISEKESTKAAWD